MTVAPVAVRDVRVNGVVGKLSAVTVSNEIIEKSPKHMVSTAQIVALCSGGGTQFAEGTRNPTNLGGGRSSRAAVSCMEETHG